MSSPERSGQDRGMRAEDRYILMIVRPGEIRYAMSADGDFCPCRKGQPHEPYRFQTRQEAMATFDRWAQKHPADASDWLPRIEVTET